LTKSYATYLANNSEKFQTIVKFECRGIEPMEFEPRIGWQCVGAESGTPFIDIDLNDLVNHGAYNNLQNFILGMGRL
jgi:hypothetical protein